MVVGLTGTGKSISFPCEERERERQVGGNSRGVLIHRKRRRVVRAARQQLNVSLAYLNFFPKSGVGEWGRSQRWSGQVQFIGIEYGKLRRSSCHIIPVGVYDCIDMEYLYTSRARDVPAKQAFTYLGSVQTTIICAPCLFPAIFHVWIWHVCSLSPLPTLVPSLPRIGLFA